jgi:2-dehydro-3-deoxygalactonokinase
MEGYSVAGDWGTSRLRLFRMEAGVAVDRCEGPGIAGLAKPPATILLELLARWLDGGPPRSINLCGMVGARGAWVEVPYVECPTGVAAWRASGASLSLGAIPVSIMAGLACVSEPGEPDVMRGEETQIFGAIARNPALGSGQHLILLPGTHSKWALVEDGRVVSFRTFITGELFALLRDHSTLIGTATGGDEGDEPSGFTAGLARAKQGAGLLGNLFSARASQLREGKSTEWALGYLSGVIMGYEVREGAKLMAASGPIRIVGDAKLARRYSAALQESGIEPCVDDGEACVLAGLALAENVG